jgi:exosortase/archaeosortase family protein
MFKKLNENLDKLLLKYKLYNLKDIILFIIIIVSFSLVGFLWKYFFNYKIFGVSILEPAYEFLVKYVLLSSYWILTAVFSIPLTYDVGTSRLYFSSTEYLYIYHGCSGLKEMAMFLVIMLFFPGPRKAKLWFIPVTISFIYLVVILRIVFLGLIYKFRPDWFKLFHEYLFNILFFLIFFVLWLVWVKYFYKPGLNKKVSGT